MREREMNKKKNPNMLSKSYCTLLLLERYCSKCQKYLAFDTFHEGYFLCLVY